MVRRTPPDRLEKLVAVAAAVFVEHGFQRAQMDDVAEALGVAKGTVYRSVESKESLLVAVCTYADDLGSLPRDGALPTVAIDQLSARLSHQLGAAVSGLLLTKIDQDLPRQDLGPEVEALVLDLYLMMSAHRTRIMVLDRCAADLPELGGDWYQSGRYVVVDLWSAYLRSRADELPSNFDVPAVARTIVELVTLWAVKMPWDPAPRPYPADMGPLCAAMIRNLVLGEQK